LPSGLLCGLAAYGLWGLIPLYFKSVARVTPLEVLAHRALWSFVVLAVLVGALGRWGQIWRKLRSGRTVLMLTASTLLIAANWLIFIYAVTIGQVLQSSLGYFVTPLVNVLLGVLFLGESLRPCQILSIALAVVGVLAAAGLVGQFPWIAVALSLSFALYALLRKTMPVDGLVSLTVETLAMTPFAAGYVAYLAATDKATGSGWAMTGLLMLSGLVTTVPLLFFGVAARRLRLSTLGILQYLSPSLQFLVAVMVFGEPFSWVQMTSFTCIWAAILLYTVDSLRATRQPRLEVVAPD
jgi:chloramphenicol-sensitive protein RarD